MIFDCFRFFNELELLEIRLNELDDIVDRFVVVEATKTHSNKDKPLFFDKNKELFKDFSEKIIHVVIDDYPAYKDSKRFEVAQMDQMVKSLDICDPEDVIIFSDIDEIPRPEAILKAVETPGIKALEQRMFYYYVNMINYKSPVWLRAKVLRKKEFLMPPKELRKNDTYTVIENGGWHFSYLGGVDRIVTKLESFSHQKFNKDYIKDKTKIERYINSGKDILGRDPKEFRYRVVPLDESFPKYLLEHKEKFNTLIREPATIPVLERIRRLFSND